MSLGIEVSHLEMMRAYAEGHDCRRRFLLIYFGEEVEQACGCCDICEADISSETSEPQGPFRLNSWVQHTEWGRGLSTYYEGDKVTVMFEAVGEKRLAVDFVLTHGRLKALEP